MTPGQKAMAGAAAGAAAGAIATGRGSGALGGAAIGAGAGYLIGRLQERNRREAYYEDSGSYPVGRPSRRWGFVFSPYYPHNLIDVRGIPRGEQVLDPSVDRVFINP
jgi:hypothetical protein